MRKESRQMSAERAFEVLDKAPYITVSMADKERMPYGLPLSLVRTDEKTFYFHSTWMLSTPLSNAVSAEPQSSALP